MGLRSFAKRLTTPVEDTDAAALRAFCAEHSAAQEIRSLTPRTVSTVVGEIQSVRIVPHQGSPWLEATLNDGTDALVVMWTGRRAIAGVEPGRRLVVSGRTMELRPGSRRLKVMNPSYELLPTAGH